MRQGGQDLQHARQSFGGPMKEHMELMEMMGEEKSRHNDGIAHAMHHLKNHEMRDHNTQHGHDSHHHKYGPEHEGM